MAKNQRASARLVLATKNRALSRELRRLVEELEAVDIDEVPWRNVSSRPQDDWTWRVLRKSANADVLVMNASPDQDPPAICGHLWDQNPHLAIVALCDDDMTGYVYRLVAERRSVYGTTAQIATVLQHTLLEAAG